MLRIIIDPPSSPAYNMAVDEALLNTSNQSNERLTLRLYSWNPPAVSLGYGQNLEEEIDPRKCESYGISIVRRITGGRIVLHDQELTYSLVGPISNSTIEPYSRVIFQKVNDILLATMRSFGVFGELAHGGLCGGGNRAVCFSGIGKNEISVNGKKIAGSAQRRTKNSLLLQGSILLGPGHRKLPLLMPDRDYARRKEISQILNSRTITVSEVLNTVPTFDELCQCLINKFFKKMDINGQKTSLENNEKKEVAWRIKNKYGIKNWNYARRIKNHDQ